MAGIMIQEIYLLGSRIQELKQDLYLLENTESIKAVNVFELDFKADNNG